MKGAILTSGPPLGFLQRALVRFLECATEVELEHQRVQVPVLGIGDGCQTVNVVDGGWCNPRVAEQPDFHLKPSLQGEAGRLALRDILVEQDQTASVIL